MQQKDVLTVIGMGKLGCTMLACFAEAGWSVTGVDIAQSVVDKINKGESPIYEPGVDALIKKNKFLITATTDAKAAVAKADTSFIIVPTPSLLDGKFDTSLVEKVLLDVAAALKDKSSYHLVVITSTVLPGDMARLCLLLEEQSGKKCNIDFGMCYNPDFIALGNIVYDFTNPDLVLIGESDRKAGDTLHHIHERLVKTRPSFHRMNFYNAELAKIAINSYCTVKITFANIIAEICEQMPGGDADAVTGALGADSRIGKKYLKGGLSYGGPCFPRDNRAFAWSASQFGVQHVLANQTDVINNYQRDIRIPGKIEALLKKHQVTEVAVLGLTYKQDTTLVEESAGLYITKSLLKKGYEVSVYDPAGIPAAQAELQGFSKITYTNSTSACIKNKKICVIASPWKEFRDLKEEDFRGPMLPGAVVIDGWSLFDNSVFKQLTYIQVGKN
jgi:UDPglucose 6-dehydrogenase